MGKKSVQCANNTDDRKRAEIKLRIVTEEDCEVLWLWANDPEVRRCSFTGGSIEWVDHVNWFNKKLKDPDTVHFMGVDSKGEPVGQVRFDIRGKMAEVSISVASGIRGRGCGTILLEKGVRELLRTKPDLTPFGLIKLSNKPSLKAFMKAGFKIEKFESKDGEPVFFVVWTGRDESKSTDLLGGQTH